MHISSSQSTSNSQPMKIRDRRFNHPVLQAAWNLRLFGLFMIGPIIGVALVSLIFDMSLGLRIAAAGMFGFTLLLYSVLLRAELRRLRQR